MCVCVSSLHNIYNKVMYLYRPQTDTDHKQCVLAVVVQIHLFDWGSYKVMYKRVSYVADSYHFLCSYK